MDGGLNTAPHHWFGAVENALAGDRSSPLEVLLVAAKRSQELVLLTDEDSPRRPKAPRDM
jgi:hypothetical protein